METVEHYVQLFGEQYRKLIVDALSYLKDREPLWDLPEPINVDEFLRALIKSKKD